MHMRFPMTMRPDPRAAAARSFLLGAGLAIVVAACGPAASAPTPAPTSAAPTSTGSVESAPPPSASPSETEPAPSGPASSEPADTSTAVGDVPDSAVFLTYKDPTLGFSVQYVEGWQVVKAADGVTIRDKDSSETIQLVNGQTDVASYVYSTDLPALRGQSGFSLIEQDKVKVGAASLVHLAYHLPAPPDPVTGKQVASTVDRYYVPGSSGIAVVSLSTPDGVDNVDAFRQMIGSFTRT